MGLRSLLGLYTLDDLIKERKQGYENGRKEGYQEGFTNAMQQKILASEALTEEENIALMEVFVKFGLEICYDPIIGGLRIRKRDRIINNGRKN